MGAVTWYSPSFQANQGSMTSLQSGDTVYTNNWHLHAYRDSSGFPAVGIYHNGTWGGWNFRDGTPSKSWADTYAGQASNLKTQYSNYFGTWPGWGFRALLAKSSSLIVDS